MSRNLLNKYIWLLETIERHGRLSRAELNDLWLASDISGGEPLARRTFYNYRNGIEEIFGISIAYNSATYEYFIENADATGELSGWLINSMSINGMLSDAGDIADRVMLEDVPSARRYLATVIDAIKKFRKVKFSYTPFYRSKASEGIIIEPYFLRIFKQRWYVIGYNSKDRMVKTYSLDRVNTLTLTEEHFDDPGISVKEFSRTFRHHDHQKRGKARCAARRQRAGQIPARPSAPPLPARDHGRRLQRFRLPSLHHLRLYPGTVVERQPHHGCRPCGIEGRRG